MVRPPFYRQLPGGAPGRRRRAAATAMIIATTPSVIAPGSLIR
jgi:hypothetical protein